MRKYAVLPHVADIRLRVEGDSLEELFRAALEGMASIIKEDACEQNMQLEEQVFVTSLDTTSLLIDFLSDVLTLSHINKSVFCKVTIIDLTPTAIKAKIFGLRVEGFDEDIKSVTYHEANVIKNKEDNFETLIIFDV